MTSKETRYGVVKSINNTNPDANGTVTNVICEDTILNDFKVLEILKKLPFEIYQNGGGDSWNWYIDLKESTIISEEEKDMIKEWLKEK